MASRPGEPGDTSLHWDEQVTLDDVRSGEARTKREDIWATPPSQMVTSSVTGLTRRELCKKYAEAIGPEKLAELLEKCVWDWGPGDDPPPWWRYPIDDDDTWALLELGLTGNYRPYQPGEGVSFYRFIEGVLLQYDKKVPYEEFETTKLVALDNELRKKARAKALPIATPVHRPVRRVRRAPGARS